MSVHISETIVDPQGRVVLDGLPFQPGEKVDVVIRSKKISSASGRDLKGSVLRYDDPFEPVALGDWGHRTLILLDTHIWVWWESNSDRLKNAYLEILNDPREQFALSVMSCWEVAKLVEYGRLDLDRPVAEWIEAALERPRLGLLPLTPAISVESTQLPQPFHRDPADQIITATARVHGIPLLTADSKILEYPMYRSPRGRINRREVCLKAFCDCLIHTGRSSGRGAIANRHERPGI